MSGSRKALTGLALLGVLHEAGLARAAPNIGITAQTLAQTFQSAVHAASYAHAVPATGTNLALVVTVGVTDGTNPTTDVGAVVWDPDTTVAGNEQTMTCPPALNLAIGTFRRIAICTLLNPGVSSGNGQVTVTFAGSDTDTFTSSATTFSGVSGFGTGVNSGAGQTFGSWTRCTSLGTSGYSCSLAVPTVADQVLFDLAGQGEPTVGSRSFTAGTGQHKYEDTPSLTTASSHIRVATSVLVATGTTTTMQWTYGGAGSGNGVGHVVLPITASSSVSAARLRPPEAIRYGALGTRIAWRTEEEVSHLGFNVWREEASGARTRLGGLLPGSMFATGDYPLGGRRQYEYWDTRTSTSGSARYWLEEVPLSGPSRWHGPIQAVSGDPARGRKLRPAPSPKPATAPRSVLTAVGVSSRAARLPIGFGPRTASRPATLAVDPNLACTNRPAGQPSVKIGVSETGWYRVERAALLAAGLPAGADPARVALYVDGLPVAVQVIGQAEVEAVEFYGRALDTRETATHVYWLVAGDSAPRRMAVAGATAAGPSTGDYQAQVTLRERTFYFAALLNGTADNFFGAALTQTPLTQRLDVTAAATADATTATVEVALQGATLDSGNVQVALNGTVLGGVAWAGRAAAVQQFSIPTSLLRNGGNDVLLTPALPTTAAALVDHVSITYPRLFVAAGDTLAALAPAGSTVSLAGFTSANVRVVDLGDPSAPVLLSPEVVAAADGTYGARVSLPKGEGEIPLFAFTADHPLAAESVTANRPSALCATRGAELAVISPRAFFDALAPLVAARTAAGWTVDLIDVEDVYDEMSGGAHTAEALASFVRRRRLGTPSPRTRYLLLVGDATFDPRNFLGKGVEDVMPTRLVDTSSIETASDDALADLDGSGVPALAVGRWPARTPEDVQGFVTRTLGFGATSPFQRGALIVAGASGGFDFVAPARQVLAGLPAPGDFLNASAPAAQAAPAQLASLWAKGPSFVAFLGHGSQGVWEGLLSMDDLSGTAPEGKPSVVAAMTCLNGFFQDVYGDCMAERLMRASNGSAAVWASSNLEDAGAQGQLALAFEEELATSALGEATRRAKARFPRSGLAMVLFGDPTLFGAPTADAPGASAAGADGAAPALVAGADGSAPAPVEGQAGTDAGLMTLPRGAAGATGGASGCALGGERQGTGRGAAWLVSALVLAGGLRRRRRGRFGAPTGRRGSFTPERADERRRSR